jgi:hypothetical protein
MSHSTSIKILLSVLLIALASCSKPGEPSAKKTVPTTFATPSEAGAALQAAAQSGDRSALLAIFGPGAEEVLFTGDAAQDTTNLRNFVDSYTRVNRWEKIKAGGEILYIGADNSAFPVPLDQNSSGRWYFDTGAGKDEIIARRIGKGELTAMVARRRRSSSCSRNGRKFRWPGRREWRPERERARREKRFMVWVQKELRCDSSASEFRNKRRLR